MFLILEQVCHSHLGIGFPVPCFFFPISAQISSPPLLCFSFSSIATGNHNDHHREEGFGGGGELALSPFLPHLPLCFDVSLFSLSRMTPHGAPGFRIGLNSLELLLMLSTSFGPCYWNANFLVFVPSVLVCVVF